MELYIPHDFMLGCLTEHGDNFTCIFLTLPFLGNKFVKWFIMDVIAQEAQNISAKILHVLSHICICHWKLYNYFSEDTIYAV